MAHIDRLWLHDRNIKEITMRVFIKMKPAGEVSIDIPIPKEFHDCLMSMAQTAADHHEQKMRAEILAANTPCGKED